VFTGGRLEIGVARGAFEYELRTFGMATEEMAAARFREGMEVVHGLLTTEDFRFTGPTWTLPPTTSLPRPIQRPCPPIWVASRSADTIRWAVQKGFGLMAAMQQDPFSRLEREYALISRVVAEVQPPIRPKLAVSRMTFVGTTDGEAYEAMTTVRQSHRTLLRIFRNETDIKGGFTVPNPPDPLDDEYSLDQLFANIVTGSPETCIEKLKMYERLGVDQYIMYAVGGDHAQTMKSLRLFGERVMPHFARPTAAR
jgi:alkanesulfonate monooxygenase SsuD/methylene tetrahydromethanopterin reductase-like flavin-dependent oxidoreductase (luciferase family)